jgi:lipocalin-like protein
VIDGQTSLIGVWKLLSCDVELQQSGERKPYFGEVSPDGYLILTSAGRVMVLITSGGRKSGQTDAQQAALFRTMVSYTGIYRVEEDRFITKVDLSWNEAWNGTDQVRYFKLDGDRLEIVGEWAPSAIYPDGRIERGILSWERVK